MTPPPTERQRSVGIDAVRVLGVAAVAAGHVWASLPGEPANAARIAIYSWQVPIFFFLTGYLWTAGRPLRREAAARARSLLVPYAIWTVLLGVPLIALTIWRTGQVPWYDIGTTIWGGGLVWSMFAPYWFLPLLFFVAVALRALERFPIVAWVAAIAGLGVTYVWGAALATLPQDVFFTLPCMLFALAGGALRRVRLQASASVGVGVGLLAASAALLATGVAAPLDIKVGDFGTPVVSVAVSIGICWALVLIARAVLDRSTGPASAIVTELATVSVVVLLTHTFFYAVLYGFDAPTIAVFVIGLGGSWLLGVIIHRTAASPWLAGVPRKSSSTSPA